MDPHETSDHTEALLENVDPYKISSHRTAFFESELFKHLTVALDAVLKRNRQPGAPSTARYHIVDIQNEKPKLGETMRFKECDNESGSPCPEEDKCFNPSFSAKNYLVKFLSDSKHFIKATDPSDLSRPEFTRLISLYSIPSHHRNHWMRAIVNVFRDLFGQNLEVFDPEVHGVLHRQAGRPGFPKFADLFLTEMMKYRARKQVEEARNRNTSASPSGSE